jgi:hypothetical protein
VAFLSHGDKGAQAAQFDQIHTRKVSEIFKACIGHHDSSGASKA